MTSGKSCGNLEVRLHRTLLLVRQRLIHSHTGNPRGCRDAPWHLDYKFEYYDTHWNLKPGERMLSYNEFKELAEELNSTVITVVHNEGMKRHREGEICLLPLSPLLDFTS